jgi:hypothetical protein
MYEIACLVRPYAFATACSVAPAAIRATILRLRDVSAFLPFTTCLYAGLADTAGMVACDAARLAGGCA